MSSSCCGPSAPIPPAARTGGPRGGPRAGLLRPPAPDGARPRRAAIRASAAAAAAGPPPSSRWSPALEDGHVAPAPATARESAGVGSPRSPSTAPARGIPPRRPSTSTSPARARSSRPTAGARRRRFVRLPVHQAPRDLAERRPARAAWRDHQAGPVRWVTPARIRENWDRGRAAPTRRRGRPVRPLTTNGGGRRGSTWARSTATTSARSASAARSCAPTTRRPRRLFGPPSRAASRSVMPANRPDGEVFVQIAERAGARARRRRACARTLYRAHPPLVPGVQLLGKRPRPPRAAAGGRASPSPSTHRDAPGAAPRPGDPRRCSTSARSWLTRFEGLSAPVGTAIEDNRLHQARREPDATRVRALRRRTSGSSSENFPPASSLAGQRVVAGEARVRSGGRASGRRRPRRTAGQPRM